MKDPCKDSYAHVLKYTSIFGSIQGLSIFLSLVRTKVLAVLLGPLGMGYVSLFNSALNFISLTTGLGLSMSAVKNLSEVYEQGDKDNISYFVNVIRYWSMLTAVLGVLVCVMLGPLLGHYTFSWGNHTLHFVLLAPAVAMMAITGGEIVILKSSQQLRQLAIAQVYAAVCGVVISIPVYYIWELKGIIPVIVLMAMAQMVLILYFSMRLFPYRFQKNNKMFHEGLGMVRLGMAFTIAAAISSGGEMLLRSYLNVKTNMDEVGLYNAIYMIIVTYAGMVFTAMETDYYPRLSGVNKDIVESNRIVNIQLEVSVLLISPMLVGMMIFLPILIPLLFSSKFQPIVPITQLAIIAMFLKSVTLPVAYLSLARGRSRSFLFLETAYWVFFVVAFIVCYHFWGLFGTGIAIVLAHIFDLVMIHVYAYTFYNYRITSQVVRLSTIQIGLGLVAYLITFWSPTPYVYWSCGILILLLCSYYSVQVMRKKLSDHESVLKPER